MADLIRQKLITKIQSQIESIVDEAIEETCKEENITEDDLADLLSKQLNLKPKRKPSGEKKATTDGYNKLPQDKTELVDFMNKLIKKRKTTKLGNENETDKIFNVITQRFIKRSSCLQRKECTLKEINFEGNLFGFTDGGVNPKLNESVQFNNFVALFEEEEPTKEEKDDDLDILLERLEERPYTFTELKKIINPQKLQTLIDELKMEDKIETDGKYIKLVKDVYGEETDED